MQIEEAIKLVNAHFIVQNCLTRYNYLLSDGAFKVINVLLSQVNYRLDNTMCAISYPELASKLRKKKGVIENYIKELINKQLITKISGKYAKTLARYKKGQIYQQKQTPTRSFYEKNIYDLRNLIIITAMYYKLSNIYTQYSDGIDYIVEYVIQTAEKTQISIEELVSPIMFTNEEYSIGICFTNIDNIDKISKIRKSDFHNKEISNEISKIRKSDFHNKEANFHNMEIKNDEISKIRKSDFHSKEKSISIELYPEIEDIHSYTHSLYIQSEEKNESVREKNKNIEKEKNQNNKEESTNILTQTNKNTPILGENNNSLFISQTQNMDREFEDKRFWLFVRADLRRKEALGLIRSAEAVMASLVEKPGKVNAIYYSKYEEYESKIKEVKLCVLKFKQKLIEDVEIRLLNYVFDTNVEQMIEQKMNTGAMICEDDMYAMVVVGEYCEECLERASELGIELIKDYYLKYESVFINRVLNVFFPSEHNKLRTQRKNKNAYHYDGDNEEETYHR